MAFEIGPRNLDRKRIVLVKYNPAKINYESICEKLNSWVSNPEITQNIKITGYYKLENKSMEADHFHEQINFESCFIVEIAKRIDADLKNIQVFANACPVLKYDGLVQIFRP